MRREPPWSRSSRNMARNPALQQFSVADGERRPMSIAGLAIGRATDSSELTTCDRRTCHFEQGAVSLASSTALPPIASGPTAGATPPMMPTTCSGRVRRSGGQAVRAAAGESDDAELVDVERVGEGQEVAGEFEDVLVAVRRGRSDAGPVGTTMIDISWSSASSRASGGIRRRAPGVPQPEVGRALSLLNWEASRRPSPTATEPSNLLGGQSRTRSRA